MSFHAPPPLSGAGRGWSSSERWTRSRRLGRSAAGTRQAPERLVPSEQLEAFEQTR
jgi:hypothetical protein